MCAATVRGRETPPTPSVKNYASRRISTCRRVTPRSVKTIVTRARRQGAASYEGGWIFFLCVGERSNPPPALELCASCTVELVPPSRAPTVGDGSHHSPVLYPWLPSAEYPGCRSCAESSSTLQTYGISAAYPTLQPHATPAPNSARRRCRAAHPPRFAQTTPQTTKR